MNSRIQGCTVCGGTEFTDSGILWPTLSEAWELTSDEVRYINRQQGTCCKTCGCSLRSLALAKAIMSACRYSGIFRWFLLSPRLWVRRVLELNGAGGLTRYLARLPRHVAAAFPEVDMQRMPYADASFDLVLHSDTLEHVPDASQGLRECLRVLAPGGWCCFTIPIITGRLTRSRQGMAASYHGPPDHEQGDFIVHTEYGSDFWEQILAAGFDECRIVTVEYPSAQAIAARKAL